jgi:hypothetical protein
MIPSEDEIKPVLLKILYDRKDYSIKIEKAYSFVLEYFDEISDEELRIKYSLTEENKFKTTIRFARNKLKNEGYILAPSISGHGIWKLSEKRIIQGRKLFIETYNEDPHESLSDIIEDDIKLIESENNFSEGLKKERLSSYYERKSKLRIKAIEIHKLKCMACNFDFGNTYGELGKGFIEVHHLIPISTLMESKTSTQIKIWLCFVQIAIE